MSMWGFSSRRLDSNSKGQIGSYHPPANQVDSGWSCSKPPGRAVMLIRIRRVAKVSWNKTSTEKGGIEDAFPPRWMGYCTLFIAGGFHRGLGFTMWYTAVWDLLPVEWDGREGADFIPIYRPFHVISMQNTCVLISSPDTLMTFFWILSVSWWPSPALDVLKPNEIVVEISPSQIVAKAHWFPLQFVKHLGPRIQQKKLRI